MLFLIGFFVFQELKPLQYIDPLNRMPTCYEDHITKSSTMPFNYRIISQKQGIRQNLVVILVNDSLYPRISTAIGQYCTDLVAEGYSPHLITSLGGTAADLRNLLIAQIPNGLIGAVMIGDLPIAWWEESSYGEDYPVDLFFSDLNGAWNDANGNGKYDQHTGASAPDIWVGRIYASQLTYDNEAHLINNYFAVNHQCRTGGLTLPRRGLVYNEVTWYPNDHGMSSLYSNVTVVNDANTTTAYDYKNRLGQQFQFVHLVAHSSCWAHTFFLQNDTPGGGSVFNFEIPFVNPEAFFIFLNCCMAARFIETDNLANWYLFSHNYTQVVIASSSLMYGINYMTQFYTDLANDSTIGAAFRRWHQSNYVSFRGTLMLGDPTLRIPDYLPGYNPQENPHYVERIPLDWYTYQVENSLFVNGHPTIGHAQNKLWIFWDSGRIVRSDTYGSFFTGSGFSPAESIAWHEYYDFYPTVTRDNSGRLWVAWQSFRDYNNYYDHFNIYTAYRYNNTWSSPQYVPPMAGHHDVQPALAAGSDNKVWIAFKSYRDGNANIYVSSASSGGAWAVSYALTQTPENETDPAIAVDRNNNVWVFWTASNSGHYHIYGRKYTGTWQNVFAVDTSLFDNAGVQVAVDSLNRIWLVWHRWINGQGEIYYTYYDGTSWLSPMPLTNNASNDLLPSITIDGFGRPWACWMSDHNGDWNICCSYYNSGWALPGVVTTDPADDIDPVILCDEQSRVWIAWASNRNNYWNIFACYTAVTNLCEQNPVSDMNQRIMVFPNPFSHTLCFESSAPLVVKIYDNAGRLITTLQDKKGIDEWTPEGLNPGVYFARIQKGCSEEYFKIVYLK